MQKKALPVRFDLNEVNKRADAIANFAGIDRAKVIRSALHAGLKMIAASKESMTADECYMMIHINQELK